MTDRRIRRPAPQAGCASQRALRGIALGTFAVALGFALPGRGETPVAPPPSGATFEFKPVDDPWVLSSEVTFDALEEEFGGAPSGSNAPPVALSGWEVQCATLIYGKNKQSQCFSSQFLKDVSLNTYVRARAEFVHVGADAPELFRYPFAVMSGEGGFALTAAQRENLRHYLENGGFLVASAGCSSKPWADSFRSEARTLFPGREMVRLPPTHPTFRSVYDVTTSEYKKGPAHFPELYGIEIDGRIALIFSPEGLNDTGNAGKSCCCCGGNEVKAAKQINVNLLTYALTH